MEEQERQGRRRPPSCLLAGVLTDSPFHKQLGLGLGGDCCNSHLPSQIGSSGRNKGPSHTAQIWEACAPD